MRGEGPSILMVDDDPHVLRSLGAALESHGYRVRSAPSGPVALEACASERPDVVLLDLALPGLDGVEVCRRLRAWSRVPIVVLSARVHESQKVQALDAGADDYVTKPFSPGELQARVRAQLRRSRLAPAAGEGQQITIGDLVIDPVKPSVKKQDVVVHLTKIEWELLRTLLKHAGRTLTHQQLFRAVWGNSSGDMQQYLRVHVRSLRRKLEADPVQPRLIVTEPGVGYRLENEP